MSIALYDFVPKFCPQCGVEVKGLTGVTYDPISYIVLFKNDSDYKAHCSATCPSCGLKYQYAGTKDLLKAASDSGGDLEYYYQRGE